MRSQVEIFRSNAHKMFVGGGWGSGKSTAAILRFLRTVQRNPYDRKVHGRVRPRSVILGPSESSLEEAMIPTLERWMPRGAIRRDRKSRPRSWELRSGHIISFRSFEATFEGANMCAVLCDEAHRIKSHLAFSNILNRARWPLAKERVTIVCGLPVDGLLREEFDKSPELELEANQKHWLLRSIDNRFLPPEKLAEYRRSVASGEEVHYLDGKWIVPFDNVFHTFECSVQGNLSMLRGDKSKPVHLALDVGDAGFALFAQVIQVEAKKPDGTCYKTDAILVVDELPVNNVGTAEDLCNLAKRRGWRFEPGVSKIFTDPTLRPDEINSIARVFPVKQFPQVRAHGPDDPRFSIEYGIDAMKAHFRDSLGNRRILIAAHLAHPKKEFEGHDPTRGIVQCIVGSKKDPRTGLPRKQNRREEHGRDCLRYLTVNLLPLERAGKYVVRDRYSGRAA